MKKNSLFLAIFMIIISLQSFSQQASLTIINKSNRQLKVKVMKGPEKKAVHYITDSLAPKATKIIYFTETGFYFTKSQAILISKDDPKMNDTIYSKDKPFQVISDKRRGYSNLTMKYTIKETKKSEADDVVPITRKEYTNN